MVGTLVQIHVLDIERYIWRDTLLGITKIQRTQTAEQFSPGITRSPGNNYTSPKKRLKGCNRFISITFAGLGSSDATMFRNRIKVFLHPHY